LIRRSSFFKLLLLLLFLSALIFPFVGKKIALIEPIKVDNIPAVPLPVVVPEKPLHNVILPDFSALKDVKQKKQLFFDFIRPAVEQENLRLMKVRAKMLLTLEKISLEQPLLEEEQLFIRNLAKKYRVSKRYTQLQKVHELLNRIDIIPSPLVLVQAANESAWGTSRFARIGLNFFGIWCYREGCGMVPRGRNQGAKHEVAAFDSVENTVEHYLFNINSHNAYQVFRTIRAQLREQNQPLSPEILATGLLPYSERGTDYVLEITQMIRHNRQYLELAQAD